MTMISYAQNREDVILNRLFPTGKGFYIDVGAADPVCHSVTKWFSSQGWTGVNVEPLPSFFERVENDRPHDINLNCIVSDSSESTTLFEVPNSIGTSTVNPKLAEHIASSGVTLIPRTVKSITLANLCERYVGDRTIDFLKIDAEGHERAVLAGADFGRWRPRVILVENTEHTTWEPLILDANYQFALFDGLNRYYVRNEDPELQTLLERLSAPANCLDSYVTFEHAQTISELESELAHTKRALVLAQSHEHSGPQAAALPAPATTAIGNPVSQSNVPAFYDEGCQSTSWRKWPFVAARRLLRRIQRPFFFKLQNDLARLQNELEQQRVQNESAHRQLACLSQRVEQSINDRCLDSAGVGSIVDDYEWSQRRVHLEDRPRQTPLKVLFAISSGNQIYSGIGRAIVEVAKSCRQQIHYEFTIDDGHSRNVELLEKHCRELNIPLHLGKAGNGSGDPGNERLPSLLANGRWDAVECVSFANASTNAQILKHADHLPIFYTPHFQPMWTIPNVPEFVRNIEPVHNALLQRAAVVACDSPWEWTQSRAKAGPGVDCALLPLGFSPAEFIPGKRERRPYLLFVGDQVETRKRFPLTLNVFAEVLKRHPEMQLVVAGNKSDQMAGTIDPAIRRHCVLTGYVSEKELRMLYREASGLMQLSDFEAFGLPILEALASGTPAFLSRRPTVAGIFGRYHGTVLIDDDTPARMAESICQTLDRGASFIDLALSDRERLIRDLSWETHARKRYLAYSAAVASRTANVRRAAA